MNQKAPIGIFDSGMGGLTVTKVITEVLPYESIIYFGDTAHNPWGDKSTATIQSYAIEICDFLLEHQCKYIIMACHTASAAAFDLVKAHVNDRAKVLNVIDPVVTHVGQHYSNKKIGLIGTKQTVRSNTYQKRVEFLNRNITLSSLATPLLVPLIEEGFAEKSISEMVVNEYLSHPVLADIHAIILGCTHYPIIKNYIKNYYKKDIDIIDTSHLTATFLKDQLMADNLLNPGDNVHHSFYVSDESDFFAAIAKIFFPGGVDLKPCSLWDK